MVRISRPLDAKQQEESEVPFYDDEIVGSEVQNASWINLITSCELILEYKLYHLLFVHKLQLTPERTMDI